MSLKRGVTRKRARAGKVGEKEREGEGSSGSHFLRLIDV